MNYKKLIVFLLLFCLKGLFADVFGGAREKTQQEKDRDKNWSTIVGLHTRIFTKNLITEALLPEDKEAWNNMLSGINEYVKKYSADLSGQFSKLNSVSDNLLRVINNNYEYYFVKAITDNSKKKIGIDIKKPNASDFVNKSSIKLDLIALNIDSLKDQKNVLKNVKKSLENKNLPDPNKNKEVASVLNYLTATMEATISKVFSDFKKLEQFVQKK